MSSAADGIQVNEASIRAAVAASLNRGAEPPAELQPPAPAPMPETPAAAIVPEGQVAASQTDLPVQTEVEDEYELDLNKNPLDDAPPVETAPVEPTQFNKQEWEAEFKQLQTTPRGREILAANREMAIVSAPPKEGGIGFRPDADQVKQWHRSNSIMSKMEMDFTSGQQGAAANFVNYWFGKDANGTAMEGAAQIAEALPAALAQENPEAYQKIGSHFGSVLIDQLIAQTTVAGRTEEEVIRLKDAALVLSAITGIKPASGQPSPAEPQPNAELAAANARIAELEGRRSQQTQKQIENTVFQNLDKVLERDADTALAPLKASYKDEPLVFNALKAQMVAEMRRQASSNLAIREEIKTAMTRMVRAGGVGQMDGVVRLWRQGYAAHMPAARSQYLKAAGIALTGKAAEARSILQQGQEKTAPNQGMALSNSQPAAAVRARQPGETMQDFSRRLVQMRNSVQ